MQLIVVVAVLSLTNIYFLQDASNKHMEMNDLHLDQINHEVKIETVSQQEALFESISE